jgi:hypothetical protein
MPFEGSEQWGATRVASAQTSQEREISALAGGSDYTGQTQAVNNLPHHTLYIRQDSGDQLWDVTVEVLHSTGTWRPIDEFTMTGIGGPTLFREYRVVAESIRVEVSNPPVGAPSGGWYILSSFSL